MVLRLYKPRWRRLARAAVIAGALLAGEIGVVRAALGVGCALPATSSAVALPVGDARVRADVAATGTGDEGAPARTSAPAVASCQAPGSLLPHSPRIAAAVTPSSSRLVETDRTARSDWKVPPPFHPPRA